MELNLRLPIFPIVRGSGRQPGGPENATNAGILAAQILALSSDPLAKKLAAHKEKLANSVDEKSRKLKITLGAS